MKKIIRQSFLFVLLMGFYACSSNHQETIRKNIVEIDSIEGTWEFIVSQPQDDTIFQKMEGIGIKKININGHWMSSAYKTDNKEVVHVAGGTYEYKEGILYEKIEYHMKELQKIGNTNELKATIMGNSLYLSGILNEGTTDEYKIEEYWVKINTDK